VEDITVFREEVSQAFQAQLSSFFLALTVTSSLRDLLIVLYPSVERPREETSLSTDKPLGTEQGAPPDAFYWIFEEASQAQVLPSCPTFRLGGQPFDKLEGKEAEGRRGWKMLADTEAESSKEPSKAIRSPPVPS